eukprot:snap_masked-scaffold_9-processed-gene-3.17-mRNA-1 protein AED:1.00 eAED:1.00 QI:0/-1/0/0/-1/1/1/0/63
MKECFKLTLNKAADTNIRLELYNDNKFGCLVMTEHIINGFYKQQEISRNTITNSSMRLNVVVD